MTMQKVPYPAPLCLQILAGALNSFMMLWDFLSLFFPNQWNTFSALQHFHVAFSSNEIIHDLPVSSCCFFKQWNSFMTLWYFLVAFYKQWNTVSALQHFHVTFSSNKIIHDFIVHVAFSSNEIRFLTLRIYFDAHLILCSHYFHSSTTVHLTAFRKWIFVWRLYPKEVNLQALLKILIFTNSKAAE